MVLGFSLVMEALFMDMGHFKDFNSSHEKVHFVISWEECRDWERKGGKKCSAALNISSTWTKFCLPSINPCKFLALYSSLSSPIINILIYISFIKRFYTIFWFVIRPLVSWLIRWLAVSIPEVSKTWSLRSLMCIVLMKFTSIVLS